MAYNLEPLIRILEQILHHDQQRSILHHHEEEVIQSLLKKASALKQKILEKYYSSQLSHDQRIKRLEAEIRDAAHRAEDIVEHRIVDHMLLEPAAGGKSFTFSPRDLEQVIGELGSAEEELEEITSGSWQKRDISSPGVPSKPERPPSPENILVGLGDDLHELRDRLTNDRSKLDIIPITGTGGIGKTTLARCLYDDKLIVEHFDIRAWITISQDYNVRALHFFLLDCITGKGTDYQHEKYKYLWEVLVSQNLNGRRYLIVVDDVWSSTAWEGIQHCFPDNGNGSRIILTTRESHLVQHLWGPHVKQHPMRSLNESDSWELLQRKVFGQDKCPGTELKSIGERIAEQCRGLPLALDVIGGLLLEAEKTQESWESIEKKVTSVLSEDDEYFSRIFSLSYDQLPDYLKPCFLYMGAFPEKYDVPASKLIMLWIAEGFIKETKKHSLEEVAASYLQALVSRNLLLVKDCHGQAESYSIHDCLRDLCVMKAKQEKFLCVRNQKAREVLEGPPLARWRRVSADPSSGFQDLNDQTESKPLVRSLLCIGLEPCQLPSTVVPFSLRLLRVLDLLGIGFPQFPEEVLKLVNLRYLAVCCNADRIPRQVSRLWNLQTLIVLSDKGYIIMPTEMWEMSELIHVKLKKTVIWIEPGHTTTLVQKKLQTISTANLYGLIHTGFLVGVSSIKKLGICFDFSPKFLNLGHLDKLETLKLLGIYESRLEFPPSITKLTLSECFLTRTFMKSIGLLSKLEVLKIQKCDFQNQEEEEEMQPSDAEKEEFCSLRFLLLEDSKLVSWPADWDYFPKLRCLAIRRCSALGRIPCDIGKIETLEIIDLDESSPSVVESAKEILREQVQYDNNVLQVRINSPNGRVISLFARDFEDGETTINGHG